MGETIRVEVLVEKIVSICDEIEALNDGDKKIAESLKNELDSYVGMIGHAKSADIILEMKENLKEKCKQTWAIYDAFKSIKGCDYLMTQKYLTKWVTYQDLYKEFFGEEVQY